jgi:UDP-N-acetylmuramate-alanine ligase
VPVVKRVEMLAKLMRLRWSLLLVVAGTHGKDQDDNDIVKCRPP